MQSSNLADIIVGDMMGRWPATVPVFIRHRMSCPGCLLARFMTVAEAAREHGVETRGLVRDLEDAIGDLESAGKEASR